MLQRRKIECGSSCSWNSCHSSDCGCQCGWLRHKISWGNNSVEDAGKATHWLLTNLFMEISACAKQIGTHWRVSRSCQHSLRNANHAFLCESASSLDYTCSTVTHSLEQCRSQRWMDLRSKLVIYSKESFQDRLQISFCCPWGGLQRPRYRLLCLFRMVHR